MTGFVFKESWQRPTVFGDDKRVLYTTVVFGNFCILRQFPEDIECPPPAL